MSYIYLMARLNMIEKEFHAHRMAERQCAAYFVIRREMYRE
jgi:hypothetical protein